MKFIYVFGFEFRQWEYGYFVDLFKWPLVAASIYISRVQQQTCVASHGNLER